LEDPAVTEPRPTAPGSRRAPADDLPRVTEGLRPVVEALPAEAQLPFIAALERGAASRYRLWAEAVGDGPLAAGLRACAAREEAIAGRIEALAGRSASQLDGLDQAWSRVREVAVAAYAGRPLAEQLAIQAAAERGGADVWRERAADAGPEAREVLRACAALEEASACFLEGVLAGAPALEPARPSAAPSTGR
jgi:hypothetical protein